MSERKRENFWRLSLVEQNIVSIIIICVSKDGIADNNITTKRGLNAFGLWRRGRYRKQFDVVYVIKSHDSS